MEQEQLERRRSSDQQLGYLTGMVEGLADHIQSISKEGKETREIVLTLQKEVALKFKTAETVFKTLKFLGLIVIAVLTFKFGDIRALWQTFFN